MKTIQGIYLIERIQATDDNDKRKYYVGMSNDIFDRWNQHCQNKKQQIDKAILNLGVACFRFQILEKVSRRENLKDKESFWINKYKQEVGEKYLYNISETTNTPSSEVTKEIKKEIKNLFNEDIGQSIYAIAEQYGTDGAPCQLCS